MIIKLIVYVILSNFAMASLLFEYEGDCKGENIPKNYYSIITQYRNAIIDDEKLYTVINVKNTDKESAYIHDIRFITNHEEEKESSSGKFYHVISKTTTHHIVRKGESYRIFVPIPKSLHNLSAILLVNISKYENLDDEIQKHYIQIQKNTRKIITFQEAKYEGLESSIMLTHDMQYELSLRAVGENPTYFMYHRVLETPMAIVCSSMGQNNRKVGWFGFCDFTKNHVVNAILLPGDTVNSIGYIFTNEAWLEGAASEGKNRVDISPLVRCKDLIIIAQDYGMLHTDSSDEEGYENEIFGL